MHWPCKLSRISLVNAVLDRPKMMYSTAVTYGSVNNQVHRSSVDSGLESLLAWADVTSWMHKGTIQHFTACRLRHDISRGLWGCWWNTTWERWVIINEMNPLVQCTTLKPGTMVFLKCWIRKCPSWTLLALMKYTFFLSVQGFIHDAEASPSATTRSENRQLVTFGKSTRDVSVHNF